MSEWTARRILKDLADGNRRKRVLTAFWKYGEATAKAVAVAQLARALHFREDSLRKLPAEKKAELLAGRVGSPEFEATFETALMLYHTREASDMMAQFLDRWNVPHVNGSIEVDDYTAPSTDQVRDAVRDLTTFDKQDVALYLASAGLLMDDAWRQSAWPVVDEMSS
jgi:hypothetical protein